MTLRKGRELTRTITAHNAKNQDLGIYKGSNQEKKFIYTKHINIVQSKKKKSKMVTIKINSLYNHTLRMREFRLFLPLSGSWLLYQSFSEQFHFCIHFKTMHI